MAKRGRGKTTHRAKRKPSKRAPAKPLKKKKLAAQKAARTRKRNREQAQIAESLRASERAVAAKRGATTRKKKKIKRELLGVHEAKVVAGKQPSLYDTLGSALAQLAAESGYPLALELEAPPEGGRSSPWIILGKFTSEEPLGYDHWADVFGNWESNLIAEATIHPMRNAHIAWMYTRYDDDGEEIGQSRGFAPGGIGAYSRVLAEAKQWCDPTLNESPSREENTLVDAVYLYLSSELYTGRILRVGHHDKAGRY